VITGGFNLAAGPGVKRGTPLTMPLAMNFAPPPPIPEGGRNEFRLSGRLAAAYAFANNGAESSGRSGSG
jgi:hypothetical protein